MQFHIHTENKFLYSSSMNSDTSSMLLISFLNYSSLNFSFYVAMIKSWNWVFLLNNVFFSFENSPPQFLSRRKHLFSKQLKIYDLSREKREIFIIIFTLFFYASSLIHMKAFIFWVHIFFNFYLILYPYSQLIHHPPQSPSPPSSHISLISRINFMPEKYIQLIIYLSNCSFIHNQISSSIFSTSFIIQKKISHVKKNRRQKITKIIHIEENFCLYEQQNIEKTKKFEISPVIIFNCSCLAELLMNI